MLFNSHSESYDPPLLLLPPRVGRAGLPVGLPVGCATVGAGVVGMSVVSANPNPDDAGAIVAVLVTGSVSPL